MSRLLPFLATFASLLVGASGCTSEEGGPGEREKRAAPSVPSVEAVQARHGQLPVRERLTGTVKAEGQVAIFPQVSGPITEVFVDDGDQVKAGDWLVRIRSEAPASQLAGARANVEVAEAEAARTRANVAELEATFERTRTLADEDLASPEAVETERARLDAARAALAQAEARVSEARAAVRERQERVGQTLIKAPIAGRVGQRAAEVGMQVDPSSPLFLLGSFDRMQVEVSVPQELLSRVRVGKPVEIRTGDPSELPVLATVSRVSPFLRRGSFSATAEIDVDDPDGRLLPGMFVTVDVLYGQTEPVTLAPKSALTEHAITGARGLYVAELDEREPEWTSRGTGPMSDAVAVSFQAVDVVEEGAHVAGVGGVEPGAWVVVIGQHLLMREGAGGGTLRAKVRPVQWERVLSQQQLQREDLLREFLAKQQRLAKEKLAEEKAVRKEQAGEEGR